jgi:hypothetical protein
MNTSTPIEIEYTQLLIHVKPQVPMTRNAESIMGLLRGTPVLCLSLR